MSTLTELIDRVEIELRDTTNQVWSTDDLTAAIRRALHELSHFLPRRIPTTLSTTEGERSYSLATLTDLVAVYDIIYPYDADDPTWPPPRPRWRSDTDDQFTLLIDDAPEAGTDNILIRYTALHTIEGLDSADTTTLDAQEEELLVIGAASVAAQQEHLATIGKVTVSERTPAQWKAWGEARYRYFQESVQRLARARSLAEDPRVPWCATTRAQGKGGVV